MYTDIDVRVCSQIIGQEIRIQIEPHCFRYIFSLMNGTNRNCVDHDITRERTIINISEVYPTTPPTIGSSTSTTDYPTCQCPNVATSNINEPKSNTGPSQTSKVNKERDSLTISLGVLVGILVILLVVVTSGWVWTCWTMKRNKATTPEHVRYNNYY